MEKLWQDITRIMIGIAEQILINSLIYFTFLPFRK